MKARPVPIPTNPRYVVVKAGDFLGDLALKMPLYSTCGDMLDLCRADVPHERYADGRDADARHREAVAAWSAAMVVEGAEQVPEPAKPPDDYEREPLGESIARTERLCGAALGLTWHHAAFALETVRGDGEPLGAFGLRVCEEIYDATGIGYVDLAEVGNRAISAISDHLNAGMTSKTIAAGVGKP